MRVFSARVHGVLDYLFATWFVMAPGILGLNGIAESISYAAAAALIFLSVLTAYPAGVLHAISFADHVAADYLIAATVTLSPWLFGTPADDSRALEVLLWSGILLLVITMLTNPTHRELRPPRTRTRMA